MANELRMRRNYLYGTLGPAAYFNVGDSVLTDASFAALPVVPATAHLAITFEDTPSHLFEIMYVISHAAGANKITVKRAQEGTAQQIWGAAAKWVHTPTVRDWNGVGNNDQKQFVSGQNYPSNVWTIVGARNITLNAYAGDVLELGYVYSHIQGDFDFDMWTLVGGKRITQVSTKMSSGAFVTSSGALFGRFFEEDVYTDRFRRVNTTQQRGSRGLYQVQPTDVATNGTVTIGWYTSANSSGNYRLSTTPGTAPFASFQTNSGDGFIVGTVPSTNGNTYSRLGGGYFNAMNHGPRQFTG